MLAHQPKARHGIYLAALILGAIGTALTNLYPQVGTALTTIQGVLLALIGATAASNLTTTTTSTGTIATTTGTTDGVETITLTD